MVQLPQLVYAFRPFVEGGVHAGPPVALVESVDPEAVPVVAAFLDVPASSQRAVAAYEAALPGGCDWTAALAADREAVVSGGKASAVGELIATVGPARYGQAAALLGSEPARLAALRGEHATVLDALAGKAEVEVAELVEEIRGLLPKAWELRGRAAGQAAWEGVGALLARVGELRGLIDWCRGGSFDEHRAAQVELSPALLGMHVACGQHYDDRADPRVWDSGSGIVLPADFKGPNTTVEVDVDDAGRVLRRPKV